MEDVNQINELNTELNIVYRYLLKLGVPKSDAEDIVQETAYKYLHYYDSIKTSKIRSWLIRVALNYHFDQQRKMSRIDLKIDDGSIEVHHNEHPENALLAKEKNKEIGNALDRLKPRYQELLLLKYQTELSYSEISNLLNINVSSIKTNLFRARKQLAKLLKETDYEK